MKEIILSSGIGFGIGAFFTLCRITYSCTKCFTRGVIYCIYVYWVSCR